MGATEKMWHWAAAVGTGLAIPRELNHRLSSDLAIPLQELSPKS